MTPSASTSLPCVNDLLAGRRAVVFLDYFACGKLDVEAARTVIAGIAEVPPGWVAPDRRRDSARCQNVRGQD